MRSVQLFFGVLALVSHSLAGQLRVTGRVTDSTGAAVPFAQAALDGRRGVSADADGRFVFSDVARGQHTLALSAGGYRTLRQTVDLQADLDAAFTLKHSSLELDEIVVNATRAGEGTGMAYTNIDAETIQRQNMGLDAPYVMSQVVGVVMSSDAGNGIGYTGLRVRGSDATRVNVTINGVPVNDAESQNTFWVDMPDLLSSVNSIQVQRGVGTSVNGAGAFGATINLETNQLNHKPYAKVISTAGSFGTFRNTVAAGTGLLNNHFTFDARASRINSFGYIDRASADLHSFYLSGGYYGKKTVIKMIGFYGHEKTYQAWNFVPEDSVRLGSRTYNELGSYTDAYGTQRFYENQVDRYGQANAQLHFIRTVNSRFNFNLIGHYTRGKGYYEEYKEDQDFASYLITPPMVVGDSVPVSSTDLIRRRWLDNDFVGGVFNLNYKLSSRVDISAGGGYNTYLGRHFGQVIWARFSGDSESEHEYYRNSANKDDGNLYMKCSWRALDDLQFYGDLQERYVAHHFEGRGEGDQITPQARTYYFFNPKAGVSYDMDRSLNIYASAAVAHKEPNRNDFVENTPDHQPVPEELLDIEAGLRFRHRAFSVTLNHYNMNYRNQLVLNGEINDVGAAKRINVARSYRRGIETELSYTFSEKLTLSANAALSDNRILDFTEHADYYDSDFNYVGNAPIRHIASTYISMSPSLVSFAQVLFRPVRGLELAVTHKYVGRQYLDNTGVKSRSIDPYHVVDARASYTLKTSPAVSFMVAVYNVLNEHYETNGYTYNYFAGTDRYVYNYLAPAATVNFLAGLTIEF